MTTLLVLTPPALIGVVIAIGLISPHIHPTPKGPSDMTINPAEPTTATVQIPPGTVEVSVIPRFGGGYLIRFRSYGSGWTRPDVMVSGAVTFHPDGTISYETPVDPA